MAGTIITTIAACDTHPRNVLWSLGGTFHSDGLHVLASLLWPYAHRRGACPLLGDWLTFVRMRSTNPPREHVVQSFAGRGLYPTQGRR